MALENKLCSQFSFSKIIPFLKLIFISVWFIYSGVLVSAVWQSESVIHIPTLLDSVPI